jgi:glutathionyl-hydroquinone reductase
MKFITAANTSARIISIAEKAAKEHQQQRKRRLYPEEINKRIPPVESLLIALRDVISD